MPSHQARRKNKKKNCDALNQRENTNLSLPRKVKNGLMTQRMEILDGNEAASVAGRLNEVTTIYPHCFFVSDGGRISGGTKSGELPSVPSFCSSFLDFHRF